MLRTLGAGAALVAAEPVLEREARAHATGNGARLPGSPETDMALSSASVTTSLGQRTLAEALEERIIDIASVERMRTLEPRRLENGQAVAVKGFHDDSMVGGGIFHWDADSHRAEDGGTCFSAHSASRGRWVRRLSGPPQADWFGARYDGRDDTPAIDACLVVFGACHLPAGRIVVSGLDIEGRQLIGSGAGATILSGKGDLLINCGNGSLVKDLSIENAPGSLGKLVTAKQPGAIAKAFFERVFFGRANYHIFSDAQWLVHWSLKDCWFNAAAIVSRQFRGVSVHCEDHCYTWYCRRGFYAQYGYDVSFPQSVFEYNEGIAVEFDVSDPDVVFLLGVNFTNAYFEANCQAEPGPDIRITTGTDASYARNIYVVNTIHQLPSQDITVEFNAPRGVISPVSVGGGWRMAYTSMGNVSVVDATTRPGDTIGDPGTTLVNKWRSEGALAGSGYIHKTMSIEPGRSHRVTITTAPSCGGNEYAIQEFVVSRDPAGGYHVVKTAEQRNARIGCVIEVGADRDYTIRNMDGMQRSFAPVIVIEDI
ncbi:hypothetical protein R6258_08795 [Halomonas sp. HP20-15]|uniref:hypothetical protein n=1 Tax=Halomonas sp. HP20-15 TaxID=3085901 RepID=UPI002980F891|nr:hypothetical protein [Halomonas sp. HP20-15]MDW5377012.1 hypothetical protein [Halomonas sp. HP20-15]